MQINQTNIDSGNVRPDTKTTQSSTASTELTTDASTSVEETTVTPSTIVTLSSESQSTETADTYEFGGGGVKRPPP